MGAIHSNVIGRYNNNNKKSRNIHQQKTLTLTLNPNPYPRLHQAKLEKYGINVSPDKNSSHEVKTIAVFYNLFSKYEFIGRTPFYTLSEIAYTHG